MNLAKRDPAPSKVRTWCHHCRKPVDWWTRTWDMALRGQYAGVKTPVLTISCHGETMRIGCSPDPEVLADEAAEWVEIASGRKRLEVGPNPEAL